MVIAPRRVDWSAVWSGATAGVAVIVAVAAVQRGVKATSGGELTGGWVAVLFVAILAAFVVAGVRAGRRADPALAVGHGLRAALVALVAWAPLRLVLALASHNRRPLAGIVLAVAFAVLLGSAGGLVGGLTGDRRPGERSGG